MSPPTRIHPWVFLVLILPFGVVSGYTTVTLAYQLKAAGVAVAPITAMIAWSLLPQTWKFFWGPVVDITLDQRKWSRKKNKAARDAETLLRFISR